MVSSRTRARAIVMSIVASPYCLNQNLRHRHGAKRQFTPILGFRNCAKSLQMLGWSFRNLRNREMNLKMPFAVLRSGKIALKYAFAACDTMKLTQNMLSQWCGGIFHNKNKENPR